MQRAILVVEPTHHGWLVSYRAKTLELCNTREGAIHVATQLATAKYNESGVPTAVSLRLACGTSSLVASRG